jgi:hypothetical protein
MPVSLERYFKALQVTIAAAANVAISGLTFESRSPSIGFARGDIHFADGSLLHFRITSMTGNEEHVVAHAAPTLADVLLEIVTLLQPG